MDPKHEKDASSPDSHTDVGKVEAYEDRPARRPTEIDTTNLSAVFENPLQGVSKEQLLADVEDFCKNFDLTDHVDTFRKGALLAQNPDKFRDMSELSEDERIFIEREHTHKWSQPWQLYFLVSKSIWTFSFAL